jgi:acetyl-CoA acetyltransferase
LPPTTPAGDVLVRGPQPFFGEFTAPYGVVAPACGFALWVRAYQDRHGIDDAQMSCALETVALRVRAGAASNPRALLRDRPLDAPGYAASPIVAGLLRKADLCLESDGACAFVVAAGDDPLFADTRAVHVLGSAQALSLDYDNFFFDVPDLPPRSDPDLLPALLSRHGLGHADLDVLGLYDACTANVLFDLENLGFCPAGTAVEWVQRWPTAINTSGGQLGEVYLQGMNQCIEVVRQLRGDAAHPIEGARLGAIAGAGAQAVALLAREAPR